MLFADVESRKRREYLIALSMCGNKVQAARLAGVHPSTPYCPAWKADEAFQAGLKQAEECAADLLESEAFRRALHGVEKPTGWYKGEAGGTVTEYSDILSIFLLKGLRPEKYAERVGMELRGTLAHIDLSQLPDHLLARIAGGEHPLAVLASAVPVDDEGRPQLAALPSPADSKEIVVDNDGQRVGNELTGRRRKSLSCRASLDNRPTTDRLQAIDPPAPRGSSGP